MFTPEEQEIFPYAVAGRALSADPLAAYQSLLDSLAPLGGLVELSKEWAGPDGEEATEAGRVLLDATRQALDPQMTDTEAAAALARLIRWVAAARQKAATLVDILAVFPGALGSRQLSYEQYAGLWLLRERGRWAAAASYARGLDAFYSTSDLPLDYYRALVEGPDSEADQLRYETNADRKIATFANRGRR